MNNNDTFAKTADGADELKSRNRGLAPRLRTMLIMVDGIKTRAQLSAAALSVGAPADFLEQLESGGLVKVQAAKPQQTRPLPAATPAATPAVAASSARASAPEPMSESRIDRYTAARKLMNTAAVDALGLRAFLFTLKLEKCANAEDLHQLLPEFTQALAKARGDLFARHVSDEVRQLLS